MHLHIFGTFFKHLKQIQVYHRWFMNYLLCYSPIFSYEIPQCVVGHGFQPVFFGSSPPKKWPSFSPSDVFTAIFFKNKSPSKKPHHLGDFFSWNFLESASWRVAKIPVECGLFYEFTAIGLGQWIISLWNLTLVAETPRPQWFLMALIFILSQKNGMKQSLSPGSPWPPFFIGWFPNSEPPLF